MKLIYEIIECIHIHKNIFFCFFLLLANLYVDVGREIITDGSNGNAGQPFDTVGVWSYINHYDYNGYPQFGDGT